MYIFTTPEGLGVAFFATGPGFDLIMYIFTTLEFSTHNLDFHLLTTSVNANIIINSYRSFIFRMTIGIKSNPKHFVN